MEEKGAKQAEETRIAIGRPRDELGELIKKGWVERRKMLMEQIRREDEQQKKKLKALGVST